MAAMDAAVDASNAALARAHKKNVFSSKILQAFRASALPLPQAALIEYNMAAVDAAIDALNAALGRGLDWRELAALIEAEKRAGNPVASTVGTLHLERNAATLLLRNLLDEEEDSDEESAPPAAPQKVCTCQNRTWKV